MIIIIIIITIISISIMISIMIIIIISSSIIIASSHHHIMIIIALKFETPSEQYVNWGNNINFFFIRDQNLPPPMNKYVDWGINVRVAANMFQSISFFGKPPPVMFFDHLMVIVGATIVNHFFHQVAAKSRFIS